MKKENKQLKNFYENIYKKGEEKHYTSFTTSGTPSNEPYEAIKKISWKNKSVLDVGCGTGLFSFLAAKKGGKVLGIDYSKEAISIAKKNILTRIYYTKISISKILVKKSLSYYLQE